MGKPIALIRISPRRKALPWFTQRFNMLSNFHANTKYVKYAHNLGITTVKLHKEGQNGVKMPEAVQLAQSKSMGVELSDTNIDSHRFSCPHVVASFPRASTASGILVFAPPLPTR